MFVTTIERKLKPRLKEIYRELAASYPDKIEYLKHDFAECYGFEEKDYD